MPPYDPIVTGFSDEWPLNVSPTKVATNIRHKLFLCKMVSTVANRFSPQVRKKEQSIRGSEYLLLLFCKDNFLKENHGVSCGDVGTFTVFNRASRYPTRPDAPVYLIVEA